MAIRIDFDFAADCSLQDALASIAACRAKIIDFAAVGPGGGNPNMLLDFPDRQMAEAFIRSHCPDDMELYMPLMQ